jgi:hypothetical protein
MNMILGFVGSTLTHGIGSREGLTCWTNHGPEHGANSGLGEIAREEIAIDVERHTVVFLAQSHFVVWFRGHTKSRNQDAQTNNKAQESHTKLQNSNEESN